MASGETREYVSPLLRRSFRRPDGSVGKQTVANLSMLPASAVDAIEAVLKGKTLIEAQAALSVQASLPHGHVALVHAAAGKLGLPALLGPACRQRDLAYALIVSRVLRPKPTLSTLVWWNDTTLGTDLGVAGAGGDELYAAMEWLLGRQAAIEASLASRHLREGGRAMFDLSSSWVEGRCCELAAQGYSRDGKKGRPQIEYGLLTDPAGRPVAIRVFPGNTADPTAFTEAVTLVREKFGLRQLTMVGDRGMITSARIEALKDLGGLGWITCLRPPRHRQARRRGRAVAAVAVRSAGPGRDHPSRLSRRTADRLPQPGAGRRACPQARGAARRYRGPAGPDHHRRDRRAPGRGRPDRDQGRQTDQQIQDGQTLRCGHHRH
ncbi:MAG TPA: transposase [Pseudonocardiaceae bacterium]|nr:transposase [Pseudonocardiaceae bacterium]